MRLRGDRTSPIRAAAPDGVLSLGAAALSGASARGPSRVDEKRTAERKRNVACLIVSLSLGRRIVIRRLRYAARDGGRGDPQCRLKAGWPAHSGVSSVRSAGKSFSHGGRTSLPASK